MKAKRDAWKKWTATRRNMETRSSYVKARNGLKTAVTEAMSAAAERTCEKADDKRIFAIAKQRAKEQEDLVRSNCLRGPDGELHMPLQERKNIWKRHFDEIRKVKNEYVADDLPVTHGASLDLSLKEIRDALESINSFKATDPSGATVPMLKAGGGGGGGRRFNQSSLEHGP